MYNVLENTHSYIFAHTIFLHSFTLPKYVDLYVHIVRVNSKHSQKPITSKKIFDTYKWKTHSSWSKPNIWNSLSAVSNEDEKEKEGRKGAKIHFVSLLFSNCVISTTLLDSPGNENLCSNAAARLPATSPAPFACLTILYLPGIDGIDAHPAARFYSATFLRAFDFPVHVTSHQRICIHGDLF